MDYKEKYLKGLEEAKKTLDSLAEDYRCRCELTKDDIRSIYARFFPELDETEEEKIRKALIFAVRDWDYVNGIESKKVIAYLERLAEKKETEEFTLDEFVEFFEKKAKQYEINLPHRGYDIYALCKELYQYLRTRPLKQMIEEVNEKFIEENSGPKQGLIYSKDTSPKIKCEYDENGDPILSGFESALFSAFSDAWQSYLKGEDVNVAQWAKEHSEELSKIALMGRVWKIMPIFKVGDFIKKKGENYVPWKITEVNEEGGYYCGNYQHGYPTELMFRDQRDYERVDNPGMGVPKINGKPISTENNVVEISHWVPSADQLEAVRYLLEDYRPWLLSASEAKKELATIYDEMLKLAKK